MYFRYDFHKIKGRVIAYLIISLDVEKIGNFLTGMLIIDFLVGLY